MKNKLIGIVVPAYNEGSVLAATLASLPKRIEGISTKIIVVDDGSTDNTGELAKISKVNYVIRHIINFGAGAATRTGIKFARQIGCDVVATIDADGQHSSKDLESVVREVLNDKADLVIGSRLLEPGGMVTHRLVGNIGLNIFTFIIFGALVSDSQSGLKAFNARAADVIRFNSNDFAFSSEIIWRAKRAHLRIHEIPIKAIYTQYSLSKGQSKLNGVNMLIQMAKQRINGVLNE